MALRFKDFTQKKVHLQFYTQLVAHTLGGVNIFCSSLHIALFFLTCIVVTKHVDALETHFVWVNRSRFGRLAGASFFFSTRWPLCALGQAVSTRGRRRAYNLSVVFLVSTVSTSSNGV